MLSQTVLAISPDPKEFRTASSWLHTICAKHGVSRSAIDRLDLCLNEALANILAHGGASALQHPISLSVEFLQSPEIINVSVSITDRGAPFDPTATASKQLPQSLEEADPGGLGLIMIRSNADQLAYSYINGANELRFTVGEGTHHDAGS